MIKKLFSKLCSRIENLHLHNTPWLNHSSILLKSVILLMMRQTYKHMAAFNKVAVKLCIFHFMMAKCIVWYLFSNWNLLSFLPETFFLKDVKVCYVSANVTLFFLINNTVVVSHFDVLQESRQLDEFVKCVLLCCLIPY